MQSAGAADKLILEDIKDTTVWKRWTTDSDESVKIILGLNTDGVNPLSGIQYSCWPLIFSMFNLPSRMRTKADAVILYGIVPGRSDNRGEGVEPN